jgi:hypothetical protein
MQSNLMLKDSEPNPRHVYSHHLGDSIPLHGVHVCLLSDPCLPSLPNVLTVVAIFPYLCLQWKSFYLLNTERRLDGIATSSRRMYLNAGFFWNSEERPYVLLRRVDGCMLE